MLVRDGRGQILHHSKLRELMGLEWKCEITNDGGLLSMSPPNTLDEDLRPQV